MRKLLQSVCGRQVECGADMYSTAKGTLTGRPSSDFITRSLVVKMPLIWCAMALEEHARKSVAMADIIPRKAQPKPVRAN